MENTKENQIKQEIKDWLQENDDQYNRIAENYLEDDYCGDDIWVDNSELDEMLEGKSPRDIINMVGDDFNANDDYFRFDGYGNLVSSNYKDYSDSLDDVIDWLYDGNGDDLDSELQEIIDKQDEDEDEDTAE